MLGAHDRQALVPEDLALFYEKVARGVEAGLFAHLVETEVLRAEVADLARAVASHRNWTAFTAAELDSLTLRHNVLIEALELDGEDKISCVRANVVGSRITAAVCSAWGR